MIMIVAAPEADITSERTSAAIEYRRNQRIHVGNAPFGLSRNEEGALEPNEDAQAARFVLQTYAKGDHSFQATADHVNATLFRFRDRGKNRVPFTKYSTRSIVSNVLVYTGFIPATRSTDMSMPDGLDDSRPLIDQMAEIYRGIEGKVTPIITRDLAEHVLSARFKRRYLGAKRGRYLYILTPVLFCHHCGGEMRGQLHRDKPWYKHLKKSCVPGQGQHSAEELERKALSLFQGLRLPPGLEDLIREKVRERQEKRPENTEVRKTIERLPGKMTRLRELYLEGDITRQEYTTRRAALQAQINQWIAKLGPADYNIAGVFDELSNLAETLQRGTPGQQKRVINAVFERIEVGLDGEIKRAEPRPWFAPLFVDLAATLNGDIICPQGTLGTDHVARILALVAIIPQPIPLGQPTPR